MDTCYAVCKTLLGQAYPFSYELDELATYYIAYRRLMDHWHIVMPGLILDVAYEHVVAKTKKARQATIPATFFAIFARLSAILAAVSA